MRLIDSPNSSYFERVISLKESYVTMLAELHDVEEWMLLVEIVSADFPGLRKDEYEGCLLECIGKGTALCVKIKDIVVGILLFSLDNNTLLFIAVHPDFRGNGIASSMIKEMIERFPPGQNIIVTTYREGDAMGGSARSLYRKIGFVEDELVEEFGYPCQRFVFRTRSQQ